MWSTFSRTVEAAYGGIGGDWNLPTGSILKKTTFFSIVRGCKHNQTSRAATNWLCCFEYRMTDQHSLMVRSCEWLLIATDESLFSTHSLRSDQDVICKVPLNFDTIKPMRMRPIPCKICCIMAKWQKHKSLQKRWLMFIPDEGIVISDGLAPQLMTSRPLSPSSPRRSTQSCSDVLARMCKKERSCWCRRRMGMMSSCPSKKPAGTATTTTSDFGWKCCLCRIETSRPTRPRYKVQLFWNQVSSYHWLLMNINSISAVLKNSSQEHFTPLETPPLSFSAVQ